MPCYKHIQHVSISHHYLAMVCPHYVLFKHHLRRHPLSESVICEAFARPADWRWERGGVPAASLRWLINYSTSLLGENTNHTKSSSPEHPSSLCLLSCVCVCVNLHAMYVTLAGMRPPLTQTCPREEGGEISTVRPPLTPSSLPPSRPFVMPTQNEPPCYVPLPFPAPLFLSFLLLLPPACFNMYFWAALLLLWMSSHTVHPSVFPIN